MDGFKGQKVQDVKKTIQKKMTDTVCERLFSQGCFRRNILVKRQTLLCELAGSLK